MSAQNCGCDEEAHHICLACQLNSKMSDIHQWKSAGHEMASLVGVPHVAAPPTNFVTKDSGERMIFPSGMQRDTEEGKIDYSLVYDGPMLDRWAALLTRGAKKYAPRNWMRATGSAELERFRKSAARHFKQWMDGDNDEDHAAGVMFNLNGYEYVKTRLSEGKTS